MSNPLKRNINQIIDKEFLHFEKMDPKVLSMLEMDSNEWENLEQYRKVHINEFYAVVSAIGIKPENILEWGSGLSTYILSYFYRKWDSKLFLTIDHDEKYQRKILAKLKKHPNLQIHSIDLIGGIWPWDPNVYNFATYPFSKKVNFDLIFIDGRRRNECMLAASKLVSRSGVVIIHDAWRMRYEVGISLFRQRKRLDDYIIMDLD